jgi:hypothetical protein
VVDQRYQNVSPNALVDSVNTLLTFLMVIFDRLLNWSRSVKSRICIVLFGFVGVLAIWWTSCFDLFEPVRLASIFQAIWTLLGGITQLERIYESGIVETLRFAV